MKVRGLRWWVIGLIVLVTIINYLDRNTLAIMWQAIVADLDLIDATGLSESEYALRSKELYSYIYMFFMAFYGVSQMFSGRLYDKIGTRKGFTFSVVVWAVADAATSLARGIFSLCGFRALLGVGEAGPWPGAVKSNAEWFPQKERAFAQGLFNSGASIGAILSPIIIGILFAAFGWKMTFVVIGAIGILWLIPWLIINKAAPKDHPWITEEERTYILDGQQAPKPTVAAVEEKSKTWGELLGNKRSYSVIMARLFIEPVWWMFVAWLPIYLFDKYGFNVKDISVTAWVPFVGAMFGSLTGGWFSGWLMRRGKSVGFARKMTITLGGLIMFPMLVATAFADDAYLAIGFMTVILFGFQFAIGNIQTLPSDFFSGKTVGSLAGLGGMIGTLGVILSMVFIPSLTSISWTPFFILGAVLVPLAVASVFIFGGKIEKQQ